MTKFSVYIFALALLFSGCVTKSPFRVSNSTKSTFYMYCTCEDSLPLDSANLPINVFSDNSNIKTNKIEYRDAGFFYVKNRFFSTRPKSPCGNNTVMVFIVPEQIMQNYTWEEIRKYQLYDLAKITKKDQADLFKIRFFDWIQFVSVQQIYLVGDTTLIKKNSEIEPTTRQP